jgi:HEAT repeat protein
MMRRTFPSWAGRVSLVIATTVSSWNAAAASPSATLTVRVDGGTAHGEACRGSQCERRDFTLPSELAGVRSESFLLEGGRAAVLIEASEKSGVGRFILLVTANDDGEPQEVLRGVIDRPKGAPGDRQTRVLRRTKGQGGEHVSFATRYESVNVCGRPAMLHVQHLDAATLDWLPGASEVLREEERDAAARLFAARSDASVESRPRLLVSTVATSASGGSHVGLTDATLDRGWSENTAGDGAGEAVVMSASSDVPIEGFHFAVRPRGTEGLAAPRTFYVVTDTESFLVTLPEDAAQQPEGTSYSVTLSRPLRTECVAVVLDKAYAAKERSVGFAEFRAVTSLESIDGLPALVAKLDAAGEEARAAEVLLSRSGSAAVAAAMAGFDKLREGGRERALDVIDSGACSETARFHAERLVGRGRPATWDSDGDDSLDAARERVRRCRSEGAAALEELALHGADDRERGLAARELASLAPTAAIPVVVRALDGASVTLRARLRDAASAAMRDPRAVMAADKLFEPTAFGALSHAVQVELLRALAPQLAHLRGGASAFALVARSREFRSRYWLQPPAGALARSGDAVARKFIEESLLTDASPYVRAQAARESRELAGLAEPLRASLGDADPRVRESALGALATMTAPSTVARAASLLERDAWTFVRVAAARALGAQARSDEGSRALLGALDDRAPSVRHAAILALGATRDAAAGKRIAEVADHANEDTDVRAAAVAALGRTCRTESVELLYKLALRTGAPELGYDRQLGMAALAALAELRPADRATRLEPLLRDNRSPQQVKAIVRDVIAAQGNCGLR